MSEALTIDYDRTVPAVVDGLPVVRPDVPMVIDPAKHFLPVSWELIEQAAALVSSCPGLAPEFRDPNNCRFIAYQSARWGMDPIAVATKTYFMERKAKGQSPAGLAVGYEAQLIMALINSDPALAEPLDFAYGYSDPARKSAGFRYCKCIGHLRGIKKPRVVTSPTVSQIKVKNSPLWYSDPDQQLAYYTGRSWARRHRPGRILGVYAREELEAFKGSDGAWEVKPPMFEEDEGPPGVEGFDTIEPTEQDGKNFNRWEAKASGEGDSRDPRGRAGPSDEGPPPSDNGAPEDMEALKLWAAAERDRIVLLSPLGTFGAAADKMVADKRFKRLLAYEQAFAKAIDRVFKGRAEELRG